jgi:hemolysin III
LNEELLNAISHGIGAALSIVALILCIVKGAKDHNAFAVVSACIYGISSLILYVISCVYHSLKVNRGKRVFRILDHCTIYFLIAGTYTPYALVTLRSYSPILGWSIFGVIWLCAALGITLTAIDMNKFKVFGMILYLVMGWMIIFNVKALINSIAISGLKLLLAAGIIYTIGTIFYGIGRDKRYFHSIFHFFVLAASILFFFSIYLYVM